VDTREPKDVKLFAQSIGFDLYALPAGDFALRNGLDYVALIERKNISDLASSITSGRMFTQEEKLNGRTTIKYLMVVGTIDDLKETMGKLGMKVNENVIYGTLASLAVRSGMHVLFVQSVYDCVRLAKLILKKISEGKYMKPRSAKPKCMNTSADMLADIPGVSMKMAEALIKQFGTIDNVCKQTPKDLQKVPNIGNMKADLIYRFLHE